MTESLGRSGSLERQAFLKQPFTMTPRQFKLFMFINLFKQTEVWSTSFKGCYNKEAKNSYNLMAKSINNFLKIVEKDLTGLEDRLHDDSEMFSKILEEIAKSDNKEACIELLKAYNNKELTIINK